MDSKFVKAILLEALKSGKTTLIQVAKSNNIFAYSELVEARKFLEEQNLIESKKIGRTRIIKLTENGMKFAKQLKNLEEIKNALRNRSER